MGRWTGLRHCKQARLRPSSKLKNRQWCLSAPEWSKQEASMKRHGLPCKLSVSTRSDKFCYVRVDPLPGFRHLCSKAPRRYAKQQCDLGRSFFYHITLCRWWQVYTREHRRAYFMLSRLFHRKEVSLRISHMHPTGTVALEDSDNLSVSRFVRILRDAGSHAGGPLIISIGF